MVGRRHQLDLVAVAVWQPATEASVGSVSLKKAQKRGRRAYQGAGLETGQGMPSCLSRRGKNASSNYETPSSRDEIQGWLKSVFVSCKNYDQQQRLAAETPEEREAQSQQLRACQQYMLQ